MTAIVLFALGSSLCWGIADFFGGLQSRRLSALAVALWSQLAGGAALLLVLLLLGLQFVSDSLLWGLAGGVFGGVGLVAFYRALAVGTMSIAAPISACGAIVPVVWGLLIGQPLSVVAALGIVAAIAGVILVSLQPESAPREGLRARESIAYALVAAVNFGLFFIFLNNGSDFPGASPLWVVAGARASSLPTLLCLSLATRSDIRWPAQRFLPIAVIGVVDTTANLLFAYASTQGNVGVVSVLGSLYPVATVMLGRVILAERLNLTQHAGVVLALAGVLLLSAEDLLTSLLARG